MVRKRNSILVYSLMTVVFIGLMVINLLSSGSTGGADSFMHYLFAKWAIVHPHLLFDHWGKPLLTILSAPFAQFGFKGMVTFNILVAIFSGYLVYLSAVKMGIKNAWLGFLLTLFTPVFLLVSLSGLTEILFAFITILSIYLFISKQFFWSAFVMSFLPFTRTEGVVLLPILVLGLIVAKKHKVLPALLIGFIVMSIAGYPFYNDLLWPITHSPYHDSSALYGAGKLLHFVGYAPELFGWPIIVLFCLGTLFALFSIFRNKWQHESIVLLLLLSIPVTYFCAHSLVWAYGMGGSLGLTRVMAGIAPIIALVSVWGIDTLLQKIYLKKMATLLITSVIGVIVVLKGYTAHAFPIPLGVEEIVLQETSDYIVEHKLDTYYMVYFNPIVASMLDLDHFTMDQSNSGLHDRNNPEKDLPNGTIVIWDAHFGPNEGGVSKNKLENSEYFKKILDFQPKDPFQVYGGQQFEVILFQKISLGTTN